MNFVKKMVSTYESAYGMMCDEMKDNVIGSSFADLARDLWEAFGENGLVERIDYNPADSFGGSLCIYLTTMPGGYFLRLWYSPKNQCYLSGIYKHVVGTISHLIPETFNEEGVFRIKSLDQFSDHFVTIMVKEKYNKENMISFSKK